MAMTYEVTVGERVMVVSVERANGGYDLTVDGEPHHVQAERIGPALHLVFEGRSFDAGLVRRDEGWDVDLRGNPHSVTVVDPRRKALRMATGTGAGLLKSSMPGRVIKVLVAEGDEVTKGQPVLVLEAMKMENELKAPCDGTVRALHVADGESVESGAKLLEVE